MDFKFNQLFLVIIKKEMKNESPEHKEKSLAREIYELFSSAERDEDITVRDDQFEFSVLFDAVRMFRHRKPRFRLVDTGRLDPVKLEWLAGNGADVYTSDEARSKAQELEIINSAAKKGKTLMAYFLHGSLQPEEGETELSFSDLLNAGRSGVYFYISNKNEERDIGQLGQLAYECSKGGSWLVYYHYGPLSVSMMGLCQCGSWIHVSDRSFEQEKDPSLVRDLVLSARSAGSNIVLHWDKGATFSVLDEVVKAGAIIRFKSTLFDYRSPFKDLERQARKRDLDFRAYYLYPTFLA
jgi:hypothetical protein